MPIRVCMNRLVLPQRFQVVFKSRGFNEMSDDTLTFVLKSDKLRLGEAVILEKVLEWATVNSVSMQNCHFRPKKV